MNIDSNKLLVAIKSYSRAMALPLDASEIHESMDAAKAYIKQANAYEGQTIKVKNEDGLYDSYIVQPDYDENGNKIGLTLAMSALKEEDEEDLGRVETVPSIDDVENPQEGAIYLEIEEGTDGPVRGYVYHDGEFINIFNSDNVIDDTIENYVDSRLGDLGYKTVETGEVTEDGPVLVEIPLTVEEAITKKIDETINNFSLV